MTEIQATMIAIFLAPIYVALLRHFVAKPLGKLAHRALPSNIAAILTKQR